MSDGAYLHYAAHYGAGIGELLALEWCDRRAAAYGREFKQGRWDGTEKTERAKRFLTAYLATRAVEGQRGEVPVGILTCDGRGLWYTCDNESLPPGRFVLDWLLSLGGKGGLVVFSEGSRYGFHLFLRHLAPALVTAGYTVRPLASGVEVKGIVLEGSAGRWVLCDAQVMGLTPSAWGTSVRSDAPQASDRNGVDLLALHAALGAMQEHTIATYGVALRPTIGSLAVHAAAHSLPPGIRWWHPPKLLAAFCRQGGAYRGGYSYGEYYRGPAWKVDINKAYTHALGQPIPAASAFAPGTKDGEEHPGVYLCRVEGRGKLPAWLAPWRGPSAGFRRQKVGACNTLCFVPQNEFAGLRSLGYAITPLYGFRYTRFVSFQPLTSRLQAVQLEYPRDDWRHKLSKGIGNNLSGKLAESPERQDVVYSLDPPNDDWKPFVELGGELVPYLWTRSHRVDSPYHHIEAAASVTAHIRSTVYCFASEWIDRCGGIVHIDTDGIVLTADPDGKVELDSQTIGKWRVSEYDPDALIVGEKQYVMNGVSYWAGVSKLPREAVEVIKSGKGLMVGGRWLAPTASQSLPPVSALA